jgi:hypothetical protein
MATGGVLLSWFTLSVAIVVFGMFNYLFWGHRLLKGIAVERKRADLRARLARNSKAPTDEFVLQLNDKERNELMHTLEQSLAEAPPAVGYFPRSFNEKDAIRGVLERLRGYGA